MMLPIRDHNPSGKRPYVTWSLMALNICIFLSYVPAFQNDAWLSQIFYDYAMIPARVSAGEAWYTMISSMFMHGGWMHLGGNMLFLFIFGDNIEDEMGHGPFLAFYICAGIAAGLLHYATAPFSQVPTVGASGAIAGVMGAYLLLFPKAKVDILIVLIVFFKILPIPAWIMLGLWFALQFAGGLTADANGGGIAYWAHAGGFVAGIVLSLPLWMRRGGTAFWQRTDGHPPHPEAVYGPSSLPKISRGAVSRLPKVRRR